LIQLHWSLQLSTHQTATKTRDLKAIFKVNKIYGSTISSTPDEINFHDRMGKCGLDSSASA